MGNGGIVDSSVAARARFGAGAGVRGGGELSGSLRGELNRGAPLSATGESTEPE